jgi:hypothetical protein
MIYLFLSLDRVHQRTVAYGWIRLMDDVTCSTSEPLAEIAALLASALLRLRGVKSSEFPGEFGESSLHISTGQSGDEPVCSAEVSL